MKPVPQDLIAFARIPKRESNGPWPQYRLLIKGVPGGFGAGYTDIVVLKLVQGWYLIDRKRQGSLVNDWDAYGFGHTHFHPTRQAAAAEMHLAEEYIPAHVREYLAEVTA